MYRFSLGYNFINFSGLYKKENYKFCEFYSKKNDTLLPLFRIYKNISGYHSTECIK